MQSLTLALILLLSSAGATAKDRWITIDSDAVGTANKHLNAKSFSVDESRNGITLLKVNESNLEEISHMMHEEHHRCGGYVLHESLAEARTELYGDSAKIFGSKSLFADYAIDQGDVIRPLVDSVEESKIRGTILKLSSFKNRYYKSKYGVQSQTWLRDHWKELTSHRSDAKVEFFKHTRWAQPSVVLTLKGESEEVVVVGGHADSIAGWFGRENATAPGADDNASGIATITEIIRVLMKSNFVPKKTIKFMGYAAEEVGLLGSKEIAKDFKRRGVDVIGAMQLDMTNYNGSDLDIVMMTDYTNAAQNAFIGKLIDEYVAGVSWGYDKCGYACSDHASWNGEGYPASMPFESRKGNMNRKIHTSGDTLKVSSDNADHATKFAKMGVAFVVELDR
ncbi:MAG: M20/M25/M40 family metallo-hydrolase [Halobacteriovoraceae bacterium]|nr:M20/M25/M40 family metallo-hydrolase [Halobacteriovoraceae bacterium]MBT5093013.1 M20/M25/M40 family metallo-hydrolase [Halobacteriovoraceae bacterium]